MDAQDGATLLRRDIESAFTHTENQVNSLRALNEEMFRSISIRFDEKERRLVEAVHRRLTALQARVLRLAERVTIRANPPRRDGLDGRLDRVGQPPKRGHEAMDHSGIREQ
jgi:hypothetical protein